MRKRDHPELFTYDALKPEFDTIYIALLKMGFSHEAIRDAFWRYVAAMPEDAGREERDGLSER